MDADSFSLYVNCRHITGMAWQWHVLLAQRCTRCTKRTAVTGFCDPYSRYNGRLVCVSWLQEAQSFGVLESSHWTSIDSQDLHLHCWRWEPTQHITCTCNVWYECSFGKHFIRWSNICSKMKHICLCTPKHSEHLYAYLIDRNSLDVLWSTKRGARCWIVSNLLDFYLQNRNRRLKNEPYNSLWRLMVSDSESAPVSPSPT